MCVNLDSRYRLSQVGLLDKWPHLAAKLTPQATKWRKKSAIEGLYLVRHEPTDLEVPNLCCDSLIYVYYQVIGAN